MFTLLNNFQSGQAPVTNHIRIRFEEREPFDIERFVAALVELAETLDERAARLSVADEQEEVDDE